MSLLTKNNSFCLLIDLQEKLFPAIYEKEILLKNIEFLLNGLTELGTPIIATEQYPKGLGNTLGAIVNKKQIQKFLEKTEFSAWLNPIIKQEIIKLDKKQVVLIGIESHICVLQTALHMIKHGFEVFIPTDCVGSRTLANTQNALQRIQLAGGNITNIESCLFEIMESSTHPQFKTISDLIKKGVSN
jgi:nicotinamidase-related amidase